MEDTSIFRQKEKSMIEYNLNLTGKESFRIFHQF